MAGACRSDTSRVGMRAQERIQPRVFQRLLRGILWVMAAILVVQVARDMR
jgi:hypothetical protein